MPDQVPGDETGDSTPEVKDTGIDALASALLRALDQRGRAMRSSDESGKESDDNQDWD